MTFLYLTHPLSRFGPGPYRVEFSIKFDSQKTGTFIVELAPLDLMPHTVYSFLQQVSRRLWDNTAFWHKDGVDHIISGRAISAYTWDPKDHYFDALGMGSLSFAEYSPDYPHKPWTIGFAGRGPNFYINAADNTKLHGPGGQGHHILPDDADPCFGTIVEGMETVREMYAVQLKQTRVARHKKDMHDEDVTHIMKVQIL
jgi:cyclophilin family peptidyl-prolyl cis-trans isomerase